MRYNKFRSILRGGDGVKAKIRRRATPVRLIVLSFLGVILLGSLLLMTPLASAAGVWTPYVDCLFTATSAACVTGLAVVDTAGYWSLFGQIVILLLIQVGGLGAMTIITGFFSMVRKRASLADTRMLMQAAGNDSYSGVVKLVRRLFAGTFLCEAAGAALLAIRFVPLFGWGRGLWFAVFHSISAFCNAGFDLMGDYRGGASLSAFATDPLVVLTISALIVVGGLGFAVLRNLAGRRHRRRLLLQTKLVLCAYGALMLFGFLFVLGAEWSNPGTLGPLPLGEKLLAALFQSVTLRTAGFNTISQQALRPATKFISGLLMLVGASPASTGGGVKVTTLAVIALSVRATVRGEGEIVTFGRKVPSELVRRAVAVALIAFCIAAVDVTAISLLQPELDFMDVVMECTSAMGTVGLSAFGSASLAPLSRVLIICTMYLGRIGPLTMALLLAHRQSGKIPRIDYPGEGVMIG